MFAIKAEIPDPEAQVFEFRDQKTMYGGKKVAMGDTVYVFASETQGGAGLLARGIVVAASPTPGKPGGVRQTPCVSITLRRTATAQRALGRAQLKAYTDWRDGSPQTELNFKFYRQATNKIAGISAQAATFLEGCFRSTGAGIKAPPP